MKNEKTGKAYGFFYSSASEERIESEFSGARKVAKTPLEMKLELKQGINVSDFSKEPELMELAGEAIKSKNNYTLIATLPNHNNKKTARELGDFLNAVYCSPIQDSFHLFEPKLSGGITYKKESTGRYDFAE